MKIFSDMHIHTDISRCCRSPEQTFDNIIRTWSEGGIKKIGLTDHIWDSKTTPGSAWYEGMDGAPNVQLKERVKAGDWDIEILVGGEADTKTPGVFGIEINPITVPNPEKNRIFSLETPLRIFSHAKKAGCKFTFGSDAHAPEEFDNLSKLQFFADELDLTEEDLHPIAKLDFK